jgi:hypothetical protein
MSEARPPLYVYTGDDDEAVALAYWTKGPNGGDVGRDIARMSVPRKGLTRQEIDDWAALICRAVNCHPDLVAALEGAVDLLEQARREANYDVDPYETDESKTTIGKFRSVLARAKVPL